MVIRMDKKTILDFAEKKKKGFDQMASMHHKLSDKYKLFSNLEDIIEIVISVLLCGITFIDCERYFHIPSDISSLTIGFVWKRTFSNTLHAAWNRNLFYYR